MAQEIANHSNMVKTYIADRIKDARRAAGLSQVQLAEATGLPQPEVSKIERGLRRVYADDLVLIGKAVGVPPSLLLEPDETIQRGIQALSRQGADDAEWLMEASLRALRQNRG